MTVSRPGVTLALATSLLGCASQPTARRPGMYPPAHESRAGAPNRSVGPVLAPPQPLPAATADPGLDRALEEATSLVGRRAIVVGGVDYGAGCGALVRAAFARAGRPLPSDVVDAPSIHAYADSRGALSASRRPARGDLVFLADAPGGPPVHVGIVVRAEPDGTALVLQRLGRGVLRVRLNLAYPERPTDPATGKHVNDTLIVRSRAVTAGSLVVGLSDLLRRRS